MHKKGKRENSTKDVVYVFMSEKCCVLINIKMTLGGLILWIYFEGQSFLWMGLKGDKLKCKAWLYRRCNVFFLELHFERGGLRGGSD